MKLATRIFNRERCADANGNPNDYYLTSKFGKRIDPITGKVKYHNGCDYGTHGNKWAQYALEAGIVENVFVDQYGAKDIWISYPRLGIRCLHGHLDKIYVKKGQNVDHTTHVGDTGKTGLATAVHLHLGVKYIGGSEWIDPESIDYQDKPTPPSKYPFNGIVKKGSKLYAENGNPYKNPASADRQVQVLGEKNGKYKVYGDTFNPHIVYVNKKDVIPNKGYPFNGVVKKGSPLYNEYGQKYKNGASADRPVKVEGELNGRYKVYGSTFNPHIVYVDKSNIIRS